MSYANTDTSEHIDEFYGYSSSRRKLIEVAPSMGADAVASETEGNITTDHVRDPVICFPTAYKNVEVNPCDHSRSCVRGSLAPERISCGSSRIVTLSLPGSWSSMLLDSGNHSLICPNHQQ